MGTQNRSTTSESKRRQPRTLRAYWAVLLLLCFSAGSLTAQNSGSYTPPPTRIVVRDGLGLGGILNLCMLLGCSKSQALGDPQGQLFMIETPASLNLITALLNLHLLGIVSIETD